MKSEARTETGPVKRLTRKERKDLGRKIWSGNPELEVVHREAAGIDIGSREHYVAVGPERDSQPVRSFGCFTEELHRLAAAETMRSQDGSDAVHGRVLDSGV
jgi:hypothetical protein